VGNLETIIERWSGLGQAHLFEHWEQRSPEQRERLREDLAELDPSVVERLQSRLQAPPPVPPHFEPHPYLPQQQWRGDPEAERVGIELLEAGRVGYLTVAGGQGSRLGYDGPKGCFPISPLRQASLFQILAEKILAARRRFGTAPPWYVMGNPYNLEAMNSFFREHGWFGLPESDIAFFAQGTFPSLTPEGTLLLADDGSLFKNPDGHGGTIKALHRNGLIDDMERRGIEELFYTQVDNPLVRVPDAAFLGIHRKSSSEMSSKVIPKAYPEEKLGVIGLIDGRPGVIEYSDLDDEKQHARGTDGALLFSHGSIAIHVINVGFLRRLDPALPLHKARKTVTTWIPDADGGRTVEREAIKFERFIFDAIPEARKPLFCETERAKEFAPLKNRTGADSIETCRAGMIEQHARWLEAAGISVPRREGNPAVAVEISPLYAPGPEELKKRVENSEIAIDEDILLV
jgi:UDP-N-acetylglucosamine/UDP-N-acetylgalactosamine diphosphorylase